MRYRILAFLWCIALIAYVQRAAISVPLQEIGRDFSLTNAIRQLGLVQSAWYFGYAIFQLPSGWLADRVGGRRGLMIYAALWSLATAITGLAHSYWGLLAAWTLMGSLQAGVFPCAVKSIGQVFTERERARASGLLSSGMLAGGTLAPLLTAWLLEALAPTAAAWQTEGWRLCLWLYAVPGIIWVAAFQIGTKVPAIEGGASPRVRSQPVVWSRVFSSGPMWLLCAQQFLRAAGMVFFLTWFPTFLRETRGVSMLQSGVLTTYAGAAGMLGTLLGGFCSDWIFQRTGQKRLSRQGIAVAGMSACAILIVISYFIADVKAAIALISLGAFCATFGGVSGYTVAIDFGGRRVGTVFGAMNMCGALGAMLFPVTVGWLVSATNNWNMALFTFAGLMALDAVCWALLNPRGTLFAEA